ncbi:MAG: NAD-dependent epimerase/dehydratase family protein, partial [Clostridiales bacterium]|nr:NAD-dependent epimerase/dehydratase family protein [Clostridiales bacterium]
MKRAVVTGATGMLAIALTNLLVKEGYDVIAVIRPGSSRAGNVPVSENVTVVELDMDEISSLPEVLSASGIDEAELFFHFAWDGTHGDSRNDMDIQIKNVRYSVEAVRAAAKVGCKAFMGAGSQAEYGRVKDGIKLSGDTPCFPENGYGIGKLAAGQMTRVEAKKFGMKHVWVRILSTYGAYDGMHTMVMSGIKTMLEGKKASYTKG